MILQQVIDLPQSAYTVTDQPRRPSWAVGLLLAIVAALLRPQRIPGAGNRWPLRFTLGLAVLTVQTVIVVLASDLVGMVGQGYISLVGHLLREVMSYV